MSHLQATGFYKVPVIRGGYGLLYNWYSVNTGILAPTGCHIPTTSEWWTTRDTLGGLFVAGGNMKEPGFIHWKDPNSGTDTPCGFNALGSGRRSSGTFGYIREQFYAWASDTLLGGPTWFTITYDNAYLTNGTIYGDCFEGHSVRCLLDDPESWYEGMTITDIDGNIYHTVQIGSQVWLVKNLKTTKYNDGSSIPRVTDNSTWDGLTTGARCEYDNDIKNI